VNGQKLVERAKKGDSNAFEQLVTENQNKVYALALRLTGYTPWPCGCAETGRQRRIWPRRRLSKRGRGLGPFRGRAALPPGSTV